MLIQFSLSNYKSFRDEILLNMIPAKSRKMNEHVIEDQQGKSIKALPIAVLYGANASGKSNLVKAIDFARDLVVEGTRPGKPIETKPFLLCVKNRTSSSRFEFVFKHKGILYTYGFVLSSKEILEEWLFARYTSAEVCVFERKTSAAKTIVKSGMCLRKEVKGGQKAIDILAGIMPANQLFLTECSNRIDILKPVKEWFNDCLYVLTPNAKFGGLPIKTYRNKDFANFLKDFLQIADTGINKIHCKKEKLDLEKHFDMFPSDIRQEISKGLDELEVSEDKAMLIQTPFKTFNLFKDKTGDIYFVEMKTAHSGDDGNAIDFDITDESDGTQKLMHLAPALQNALNEEKVYILDELDRSLHPLLAKMFIQIFLEGIVSRQSRSQFIFTTHDTNLLMRELLRRDEIWFIEKDKQGSSHLTSLAEYHVTAGLNYENGYLNGRFGAIPFIGNWHKLLK